jgi:hypothetical protein
MLSKAAAKIAGIGALRLGETFEAGLDGLVVAHDDDFACERAAHRSAKSK